MAASSCFGCLGLSQWEASVLALWDTISQNAAIDPVADFIARAGITDQTYIDAVTALHAAAVANGWWDKCDLIYPFVGGTAQAHAQNLKSALFTITWAGTVTHDANGITGNGVDGYGDTGYIPSASSLLTLNSAHLGIYRRSVGTNFRVYSGIVTAAATFFNFSRGFTTIIATINSAGGGGASASAVLRWSVGSRIDAINNHLLHAGVDNSTASASTVVPNLALFVMAQNSSGVMASPSNSNLAGLTAGSGLNFAEYVVMAADWQTFNTSLGRQV